MVRIVTLLLLQLFVQSAFAQKNPAYQIFNNKGQKVSYKKWVKKLKKSDIVLFGEQHDNPIAHWLQLELANSLNEEREMLMGAEMIETDDQPHLNKYLEGKIDQKGLDTLARLWRNYHTDYAPLVDFAKSNQILFIGTNVPRRYASMVYRGGFEALDTLSDEDKKWIAPLPIAYDPNLPGYQKMLEMGGVHGGDNLPKAQAIKDATMAYSIHHQYLEGRLFLHFNGAYHSDHYEGILWYLERLNPDRNIKTISTVSQSQISRLDDEHKHKADFIICVPDNMTKTYKN